MPIVGGAKVARRRRQFFLRQSVLRTKLSAFQRQSVEEWRVVVLGLVFPNAVGRNAGLEALGCQGRAGRTRGKIVVVLVVPPPPFLTMTMRSGSKHFDQERSFLFVSLPAIVTRCQAAWSAVEIPWWWSDFVMLLVMMFESDEASKVMAGCGAGK